MRLIAVCDFGKLCRRDDDCIQTFLPL
jgi:hypothetical protein